MNQVQPGKPPRVVKEFYRRFGRIPKRSRKPITQSEVADRVQRQRKALFSMEVTNGQTQAQRPQDVTAETPDGDGEKKTTAKRTTRKRKVKATA